MFFEVTYRESIPRPRVQWWQRGLDESDFIFPPPSSKASSRSNAFRVRAGTPPLCLTGRESVPLRSRRIRRGKLINLGPEPGTGGGGGLGRRALPGVDRDSPSCWITTLAWNEFPARPAAHPTHTHSKDSGVKAWALDGGGQGCLGLPGEVGRRGKPRGCAEAPSPPGVPPGVFSAGSLQAQRPAAAPTHRLSRRKERGSRLERKAVSGLIRELRRGAAEAPGVRLGRRTGEAEALSFIRHSSPRKTD